MNFKKLLDLFEAPVNLKYKGTAGTQAIQQATNQAKPGAVQNVNKIKPGQQLTLPGGGSYQVKAGDTLDKIARRNPAPTAPTAPTVSTATGPAATAPAPSTDNELLKGQTIAKAMAPAPTADTRSAVALQSKSAALPPVAQSDALSPGETIDDTPAAAADTRGAVALQSKSAAAPEPAQAASEPAQAAPEPAPVQTANASNSTTPAPAPAPVAAPAPAPADSNSLQPSPDRFSDYPQGDLRPGRQEFGFVSEDDAELNELMRLSGRPVNEKAVSKQQQKFMGMVHAMQKGKKIKGASPELKKVAKTMNNKDAKDFASTKHKGLPTKVSESVMLEAGSALEHIINKFKHETKNFLAGEELDHDLFESLFDYYSDNGEMPYAIRRTAGDTDPYQWIDNKFEQDLSIMGYQRDFNAPNNLAHDRELTELARLAGLTNEDGPGAAVLHGQNKTTADKMKSGADSVKDFFTKGAEAYKDLYMTGLGMPPDKYTPADPRKPFGPKKSEVDEDGPGASSLYGDDNKPSRKFDPIDTLKQVANKGIDTFNDYEQRKKDAWDSRPFGGTPGPGHSGYIPSRLPRFQTKADSELADRKATDRKSHDLLTGANAAAASTPPADPGPPPNPKRVKEDADLNQMRRIAGLTECGDMGMDSQPDSMNVSTNMSSDGTKSVSISAQGDQADALLQMLKMAGMRPHDNDNSMGMTEPEIIMVSSAPHDDMHDEMMHDKMMGEEELDEYANRPEQEYHSIDSILRQGNDLNRKKRQYAGKPRLGDNPMAEAFALDLDLDAMLESILIREEDSAAKKVGDAVKNPGNAAKDVGDKVKGRLTTTKDTDGKTSVKSSTGRIRATFDKDKPVKYEPADPAEPEENEKTNEGMWDDVSNFVGDVVGTEASHLRRSQQLRDLDAMRKQYKGTPYEKQVNDRYDTHLNRLQLDKGDVMDYDPKTGIERLKPVVPPDQWKGGN